MAETVQHWSPQEDFGTPASPATETVELTIDGANVQVPAGTSIMRAALTAGIAIPKLCATDSLESFGSCRVCLVEVANRNGLPLLSSQVVNT